MGCLQDQPATAGGFLTGFFLTGFFDDLRALTRYLYFASWQQLLTFMYQQLDLAPEPG